HSFVQQQRLGATEARTLLGNAWTSVTGSPAQPQTSALLTAHWALETDSGRCMPGHNFAGIKAAPGAAGKSFLTVEGHGGSRREVNARFRVYESAEAGALDYVRLLTTRYPDAVAAARAGDSAGFARALARGGYFTAAPEAYAAGLSQRLATLEHGTADHGLMAPPAGSLSRTALEGLLRAFRGPANG
ncbi:MAG TPA: glucosaminidase domain-containing protein, partial [Polyangiaceae bacterium]|nr:glucosaminidase domain-containing protein [Polyangiaceae bacterium]